MGENQKLAFELARGFFAKSLRMNELLKLGLYLLAYGMGTVFLVLSFLAFFLWLMRWFENFGQNRVSQKEEQRAEAIPLELVSVIAVAIDKYLSEELIAPSQRLNLRVHPASRWKISARSEE